MSLPPRLGGRVGLALAAALVACSGDPEGTASDTQASASSTSTSTSSSASESASSTSAGSTASTTDGSASTATSTAGSGTGAETDTSATTTGSAEACPRGESYCCNPWLQDCPEGEKCMPYANDGGGNWNATGCFPIDPAAAGYEEPCSVTGSGVSGIDTCDKGLICWDVDGQTLEGHCAALCQGDVDACGDGTSCCPAGSECSFARSSTLDLCVKLCDPIDQDCPEGSACYPLQSSFHCAPDNSGDVGAVGDPCEYVNVCDPGTFCADAGVFPGCDPRATGCCAPFCSLKAPSCPPETECTAWFDQDPPVGYEDVGACVSL